MGLEKIIDFIIEFITDFLPFFVVKEWEKAVVLRFGRLHRVRSKGFYFKIPFVDDPRAYEVVTTTLETPIQSMVTSDDKDVTIKAVVKYNISDVEKYTTEIFDAQDAVTDLAQGHIMTEINTVTYEQCRDTDALSEKITKKVRAEVKKYGVYIEKVTLTNFIKTRNIRLFNDTET